MYLDEYIQHLNDLCDEYQIIQMQVKNDTKFAVILPVVNC